MVEFEAKRRVVAAGRRLLAAGLIVRTWGNVSVRIGEDRFAITPSGKPYDRLTPDDIALVNVADGKSAASAEPAFISPTTANSPSAESPGGKNRRLPPEGETRLKPPKPSSEKDLHAAVYRLRPDVRFVIHTHQVWASAVSALRRDIDVPADLVPVLGAKVRCAAFALPTTKKLAGNVAAVLQRAGADERAVLLAGHGTVCFGADDEEAFAVAEALEVACRRFFRAGEGHGPGAPSRTDAPSRDPAPDGIGAAVHGFYNSRRFDDHFKLYIGATGDEPFPDDESRYIAIPLGSPLGQTFASAANGDGETSARSSAPSSNRSPVESSAPSSALASAPSSARSVPLEAAVHRRIYERWSHIRAIIHNTDADVVEASLSGRPIRPYLDDFAQLVGPNARAVRAGVPLSVGAESDAPLRLGVVDPHSFPHVLAEEAAGKLRGRFAVMLKGHGALCCGPNESDAVAAAYVMAKNCKAFVEGRPYGGARPIPGWEAWLMRLVYIVSYSKRAAGASEMR